MRRLLLITVCFLAAAAAVAVPAVIGLAGNPSFSHQLPVRVPSQARSGPAVLTGDSLGQRAPRIAGRHDDRREDRHAEPGDDRGRRGDETHGRGRGEDGGA